MPKILDYNTLTTAQGCNVLFMGDKASSSTNPEIKNITVDNLFKRESLSALNASGITFYDDGGNASLFIKDGGNVGVGGTTANYDLQVNGDFYVTGGIFDCTGASGSANQYLKSLGSGNYQWVDTSTLGGGTVSGGGSANYIPKWSSSSALTNSIIYEVSSKIGIGEISPGATFHSCGTLSGSDAIVQNCNGAIVELRRNEGTTVTDSLYLSNTGSGFSLGSSNSFANSNININNTGSLGVRTTTLSAALNVSNNQSLVGDFYSSDDSGSVIYFKNTSSCSSAYSNVVSYSSNDGSQKVNWITGTFQDGSSNKYFGIGYKNVNLSSPSCAKFDTTTVCNNLFYINTGGSASLAHNIHTHNKTNTGHNTGRFICVQNIPFTGLDCSSHVTYGNWFNFFPAMGQDGQYLYQLYDLGDTAITSNSYSSLTDVNFRSAHSVWSRAPYDGRLIKAELTVRGSLTTMTNPFFKLGFWCGDKTSIGGQETQYYCNTQALVTYGTVGYKQDYGVLNLSSLDISSTPNSYLGFNAGDYISAGITSACGSLSGILRLHYELKIT